MKKVLCMTRKYPPSVGGMERFCYDLYSLFEKDNDLDVNVVALGKSQKHLVWFFPYCFFYLLFNARKYDVIVFSDALFAGCAWIAGVVSPKTKKITDIHGLDITYPNPIYRLYMKMFLKKFDLYVCNSKNTEELVKSLGINNTTIINRGVNIHDEFVACPNDEFRAKYGINDNTTVIITVGRLVKRKGVEWFINDVMPKLNDVVYMVAGGGPEKENIEKAIQNNHLEDKVKLLGKISDEDLNSLYYNADIFAMPNIPIENDVEGFGIVAIEASYKKCIVIAADIDGIADAVVHEKNGFLVECKNVVAYVDRIQDYIASKNKYKKLRENFAEYTMQEYSMEAIAKKYKKFILGEN